ncbi:MAG TPA: hypothetical protein VHJ83_08585 [Micromonosporaceae bacterium]|nr:hypothetical protein [Micromonosporaceae bacterium]
MMRVTVTPGDNEITQDWAAVGEHALGIVESSGQYLYFGGRSGLNLDD